MSTFVLICRDKPGALDLRIATREAHLAWLYGEMARVVRAGPILGQDGEPIGSILTLEVASRADVEAFTAADPYAKAGLFECVEILNWRQTVGPP